MQLTIEMSIIHSFRQLQKEMTERIRKQHANITYLSDRLDIDRTTFYKRLKNNGWTDKELEILIKELL